MSMRHYGVQAKCLMLNSDEFRNLIYNNRNNINELEINDIEDIDYEFMDDFIYSISNTCWFSQVDGTFKTYIDKEEDYKYLDEEDIYIFELEKDTLFECYGGYDEIYEELQNNFKKVGIIVNKEYIKEHFGYLSASYYG